MLSNFHTLCDVSTEDSVAYGREVSTLPTPFDKQYATVSFFCRFMVQY